MGALLRFLIGGGGVGELRRARFCLRSGDPMSENEGVTKDDVNRFIACAFFCCVTIVEMHVNRMIGLLKK